MFLQLVGYGMGTKLAPLYQCLSVGYLEKSYFITKVITLTLLSKCNLIEEIFKRFKDNGFVL